MHSNFLKYPYQFLQGEDPLKSQAIKQIWVNDNVLF